MVHYSKIPVERKNDIVTFLYEISRQLQRVHVSNRINVISKAKGETSVRTFALANNLRI